MKRAARHEITAALLQRDILGDEGDDVYRISYFVDDAVRV